MSTSGVTLIPVIASSGRPGRCRRPSLSSSPASSGLVRRGARRLRARRGLRSRRPARTARRGSRRGRLEVREQHVPERVGVRERVATMRWNALNAATAGMAMRRPIAVATSASEMRAMTASGASCGRPAAGRRGQLAPCSSSSNARDDADDGAEQPDERRVVSQRAEEGEALLELDALERARAVHRLLRGVRRRGRPRRGRRRRPPPPRSRDASSRRRAPSRSPPRSRRPRSRISAVDVVAQRPVEPRALEHDGQRDDAQEQHERRGSSPSPGRPSRS